MPQGPIAVKTYAQNAANVTVPVKSDTSGDLFSVQVTNAYVTCSGNATTKLGGNGAIGDVLQALILAPGNIAPGNVSIEDGNTAIQVFTQSGNLSNTSPIEITFGPGIPSATGAWSVILPVNVSAIAVGKFTP